MMFSSLKKLPKQGYITILINFLNMMKLIFLLAVAVCFIFVVKNNFSSYLDKTIKQSLYYVTPELYYFPKVTICPSFEFNAGKFLKMMNIDTDNSKVFEITRNMESEFMMKFNLTGKELTEKAGWNLGEMVEELKFEDIYQRFDKDTTDAILWERRFWIHMSCFTFKPPPTKNRFAKLNIRVRSIKEFCSWYNTSGLLYFTSNEECPKYKTKCLKRKENCQSEILSLKVIVYAHSLVMNTKNLITGSQVDLMYANQASDLVMLKFSRLGNSGTGSDFEICIKKCLFKYIRDFYDCSMISTENLNIKVKQLCTNYHLEIINAVRQKCSSMECQLPKVGTYWLSKVDFKPIIDPNEYKIALTNSEQTQHLVEEESYTIINFLSDLGGNMGFFYGISLLYLLSAAIKISFSYVRKFITNSNLFSGKIHHINSVLSLCISIILLLACILQMILIFQRYINQNQQLIVSYENNKCIMKKSVYKCVVEPTYKEWIIGYIAQRGVGCRIPPRSDAVDILFTCINEMFFFNESHLSPYAYNDDLPQCNESNLKSKKYIFEEELSLFLLNYDWKSDFCIKTVERFAPKDFIYPIVPRIRTIYTKSMFNLLPSLAGTISLYFTINILTLPDLLFKNSLVSSLEKRLVYLIHFIVNITLKLISIAYVTLFLMIKLNESYINPIITSSAEPYNFDAQNLLITACPWKVGSDNYFNQLYNTNQSVDIRDSEREDIYKMFSCDQGTLNFSENHPYYMGNCIHCTYHHSYIGNQNLYLNFTITQETHYDLVFFMIHEDTEQPVFDGVFKHIISDKELMITIGSFQKYISTGFKKDETYNQCYSKCLSKALLNRGGIDKLYLVNSLIFSDLELLECQKKCKSRVYSLIESYYKHLAVISKSQISAVYRIPKENGQGIELTVINLAKRPRILLEKSGVSVFVFINDLGTIIGFCFGFSLISISTSMILCVSYYLVQLPY